ncbi:MAG: BrnA antitoxin family protein [Bryobacteraceae bacterium]
MSWRTHGQVDELHLAPVVRLRDARPRKVAVSVRLDAQVLAWLRSKGGSHLTRINGILTNLMEAEQRTRPGR